jgi:hypothetical protein
MVSEASCDNLYQQLLGEIRELFVVSNDRTILNSCISSLYHLAHGRHQLSDIARQELNRLAHECGEIEGVEDIGKFVAAARLVDVSGNGKICQQLLDRLSGSEGEDYVADSLECLCYFFEWDVNRRKNASQEEKEAYIPMYKKFLQAFGERLSSHSEKIRVRAFRGLSSVLALSPLIKKGDLFSDEMVKEFYSAYQASKHPQSLLMLAKKPLTTGAVNLGYSAYLFVHCNRENVQNEVKLLWRELSRFRPICGKFVPDALRNAGLQADEMRAAGRFLVGKVVAWEVLKQWFLDGEDDSVLPGILPFVFAITSADAVAMMPMASKRWDGILSKISNNEKPTQKMVTALCATRKVAERNESEDEIELDEPQTGFLEKE